MLVRVKSGESWFLLSLRSVTLLTLLCIIALNLKQTHALGISSLTPPLSFLSERKKVLRVFRVVGGIAGLPLVLLCKYPEMNGIGD